MLPRSLAVLLFPLLLACSGPRSAAELPPTDAPPPEQVGSAPVAAEGPQPEVQVDLPVTPIALYEGCRDRVEGPQAPGECTTDADCTKVGCSQEMCVASGTDILGTCEILPCFRALDACGCHDGMCTWTVQAELPAPGRVPLPVK